MLMKPHFIVMRTQEKETISSDQLKSPKHYNTFRTTTSYVLAPCNVHIHLEVTLLSWMFLKQIDRPLAHCHMQECAFRCR